MITSEDKPVTMEELAQREEDVELSLNNIGVKILTKDGEKVGRIESMCFDADNGLITHSVVSDSIYSDLLHGTGSCPAFVSVSISLVVP